MQFLQYDAKCVAKNKQQPPKGQKKQFFKLPQNASLLFHHCRLVVLTYCLVITQKGLLTGISE